MTWLRPIKLKVSLLLLLMVILCSMLLIGCEKRAIATQRLAVSLDNDIKTFNPVLITDAYSQSVSALLFASMVGQDGKTGEVIPDLAEKWEILNQGKQVIFTLREKLKWSDGKPLTADDVVFTFKNVIYNEKIPSGSRDVLRIGKEKKLAIPEKLSDRRISFTLPEPFAPFLRNLGGTPILPKHILESSISQTDEKGNPKFLSTWRIGTPLDQIVVSGGYQISEYRPAERIVLKRNPFYYKQPKPLIERFVYQIISSPDASLLRFQSGDLDLLGLRGEDFQLLKRFEKRDHFTIYNGGPDTGQSFMMFNLNKGKGSDGKAFVDSIKSSWFQDVRFRRAIAYGINREAMINSFYRGLGKPQNSPIPELSPYYLKTGLPTYEFSPEQAKKLLKEAGFKYNAQERLEDSKGNLVRFGLITGTGGRGVLLGAKIKTDLDQIGITVDFNPIEFGTLIDRLDNSKQWDTAMLGFTGGIEPHGSFNLWSVEGDNHMFNKAPNLSEPAYPGREVADWEQKINDLMIQGSQELDEDKRKQIYGEFQLLVREQLPLIHLVTPLYLVAMRDRIQGAAPTAIGRALWNLDELKLVE